MTHRTSTLTFRLDLCKRKAYALTFELWSKGTFTVFFFLLFSRNSDQRIERVMLATAFELKVEVLLRFTSIIFLSKSTADTLLKVNYV